MKRGAEQQDATRESEEESGEGVRKAGGIELPSPHIGNINPS